MSNFNLSIILKAMDQASAPMRKLKQSLKHLHDDQMNAITREMQARKAANRSLIEDNRYRRDQMRGEMLDIAGLAYAMSAPIRAAMQFESAMADVAKVVDFDSPEGLKAMEKTIKQLSREIPLTQAALAQIVASGGQLGIAADNLDDFATIAAKMAIAFDMTADAAGDSAAKLKNVFGLSNLQQVSALGDAVNHLSNNTAATASEMVSAMLRAGGMARSFGISAAETAALANSFIALGKAPEVAGTAINAMLIKMQTASQQGKKFSQALNYMGMSAVELEDKITNNAQGALTEFFDKLEAVDESKRAKVIGAMFGLEYADDISLMVGSLDEYRKALSLVSDQQKMAGSMEAEFAARAATTENNWTLTGNSLRRVAINIGALVLPAVNAVLKAVRLAADAVSWFTETFPMLTQVLSVAVAGLVTAKVASFAFGYGMLMVKGAIMSTAVSAMKLMPVLKGITALMMANPLTTAAALIAGGAYLIYKNWSGIKEFFSNLWESIKSSVPDWIVNMFGGNSAKLEGSIQTKTAQAAAIASPIAAQQPAQVGGSLDININSEGRARVVNADTTNKDFGLKVFSGQTMVTP